MRYLHIATEDEQAAIDQAIEADRLAKSTDPTDVANVANFKEELERLKNQGTPTDDTPDSTTSDPEPTPEPEGGSEGSGDTPSTDPEPEPTPEGEDDGKDTKDEDDDEDAGTDPEAPQGDGEGNSEETEEPTDAGDKLAEEAISTAATLSRIYDVLHRSNQRGGVQSAASAMAIESIINVTAGKVGIKPTKTNPYLGNYLAFESISTRESATAVAMEELSGMLTRIWEAIKNFFVRIFNWVREFFSGSKQRSAAAKREIDATAKLAQDVIDKEAKAESSALAKRQREDKLRNITRKVYRSKASQLTTGDVDVTFEQLYQISRRFSDLTVAYIAYSEKAVKRIALAAKALTGSEVKLDNTYSEFVITDAEAGKLNASRGRPDGAIAVSKYNREIISEPMPGNCTFNAVVLNASKAASFAKEDTVTQATTVKEHYFRYERRNGTTVSKAGVFFNGSAAQMAELMAYAKEDLVHVEDVLTETIQNRFDDVNRILTDTINRKGSDVKRIIAQGKVIDNVGPAHHQALALVLSNYLAYFNATLVRGHASVVKGLAAHIEALVDYASSSLRLLESTVVNPGQD